MAGFVGATILARRATGGQWKPPQQTRPVQQYFVLIDGSQNAPAAGTIVSSSTGSPTMTMNGTTQQMYVFDAVLRVEHSQESQITSHPVQTGANISDHAYAMPARITLDIGMSDAMASYVSPTGAGSSVLAAGGAWTGPSKSKSVNAYSIVVGWATKRVLLTLGTRLKVYSNMMVESISPEETSKTVASLRCRVTFKQVIIANIQSVKSSVLPQTTQSSSGGATSAQPVPAATQAQFQQPLATPGPPLVSATTNPVVNAVIDAYNKANVPGSGLYSSMAGQSALSTLIGIWP